MNKTTVLVAGAALVVSEMVVDHRLFVAADSPHSHIEIPEKPVACVASPFSASGALSAESDWQQPALIVHSNSNIYPQPWTFDQQEPTGFVLGQIDDSHHIAPRHNIKMQQQETKNLGSLLFSEES